MPVTSSIVRVEASRHACKETAFSLLSDRNHIKTECVLCMYDLSDSSDFESMSTVRRGSAVEAVRRRSAVEDGKAG